MMDLQPYPTYKDSGVEWLGEVPEHWEVRRGKNLFRCIDVRSETGEEELLTVSSERGVVPRRSANVTMFKAESYVGHKLCWPGDLVINSLWAWARGLGVSRYHGIISTAYGVYRPKEIVDARFIHELVRSTPFHWELRVRSKGVWTSRLQLTDDSFLCAPFPLPPLPEQTAIVRFLDHIDSRIRRYIRAKQKLIGLLEEQKQAIISGLVIGKFEVRRVKGEEGEDGQEYSHLTPRPSHLMKPSGVEWLGDVPEHWEELLLGRCLRRIDQGWSPVAAEGEISQDQWSVLTLSSVKRGVFDSTAIKPIPVFTKVPDGIDIKNGDLLLTRSNTRELVGDVCIVQGARPKTVICDLIYRLTPKPTLFCSSFLMYQLLSPLGRRQIERDARGSSATMPKIAQRHIRSWRVLSPPLEEQNKIVEAIQDAVKNISDGVKRVQAEIELLHEYRTRLIADVVTGKLDVSAAVANLPEEPDLSACDLPTRGAQAGAQAGEPEPPDETDDLMDDGDAMADNLDRVAKEMEA